MPLPWWSSSPSSSSSPNSQQHHHHQRRLTRAKQLRYLRDHDIKDLLKSSARHRDGDTSDYLPSYSLPPPQPLPLPDLSALFSSADKFVKAKSKTVGDRFRLPSPNGASSPGSAINSGKEKEISRIRIKERERSADQPAATDASKVAPQDGWQSIDGQRRVDAWRSVDALRADPHNSIHRAETWSSRDAQQDIKCTGRAHENFSIDIAFRSAPPSTNASPMRSPQRMLNGNPFSLHPVEPKSWSDPAVMYVFSCAAPAGINMVCGDRSPHHSPQVKSPMPPRNSISGPASPRHPKLSVEISSTRYDNNALMNVHPLPLPPTPTSSAQTSPVPQIAARPEFCPMKSQWTKGKLIGRGTFGSVYVATNRGTGALCAMKEVELLPDDPKSAECMKQLEQEIKVLSHLKHPNIVQYYGSEIVDDRFYIYLEYVYPGSINKYVREHCGAITEAVVRNFTRHILSGLAYLHGRKTIHRDIKGANLLVDASGVVKLADFGMAKHLTGQAADLSMKGSPYWMAPELMHAVLQKDNSSDLAFAVDIWSLGCTIIEMLTGNPPWSGFEGAAAMFKVLRESPPIPETLSSEGKDFLRCCFRRNPADRPPASKLLEHPFSRNTQQMDVPSSSLPLNPSNLTDKAPSPREMYDHRVDRVPPSPSRWTDNPWRRQ